VRVGGPAPRARSNSSAGSRRGCGYRGYAAAIMGHVVGVESYGDGSAARQRRPSGGIGLRLRARSAGRGIKASDSVARLKVFGVRKSDRRREAAVHQGRVPW
jgi:hypothetical protein